MPFRFPLQSVLRLRRSLERQEEQRLLALAAVVSRLASELKAREEADFEERRAALADMETYSSGAQLQFRVVCDASAQRAIVALRTQLKEAEDKRLAQLKVYHAARQRREIFEGLRKRQKEIYDRELTRQQQQENDEAFLLREFMTKHD